jgi:hypothetical protein
MGGITYNTTVLIAAERGDRQMWSRHLGLLRLGAVPVVPARCSLKRGAVGPVKRYSRAARSRR